MIGLGIAGMGALLGSDMAEMAGEAGALSAEQNALKLQESQTEVAFSQKTLNNIEATKQLMGEQAVRAAGEGASLASPTVKAITFNTFQTGKKTQQNIDTEAKVAQLSYQSKIDALQTEKDSLPWKMLGNAVQQGTIFASLF